MGVKCFLLVPLVGRDRIWLRRYAGDGCPGNGGGYHNAMVLIAANAPERVNQEAAPEELTDPRWPKKCDHCAYVFDECAPHQIFTRSLYRRSDTGAETTLLEAGPGAMWDATWFHGSPAYCGTDGRSMVVRCPNGHDWMIDSVASNCTDKPSAERGDHKCWIRHGEPPNLTVDKAGVTCSAGAGSIQAGNYHGFLRNGEFTPA